MALDLKPGRAETTAAEQPKKRVIGRPFKKGQSGNPAGRPKGSKHKLAEQLLAELQRDFQEHGAKAIVEMRQEKPAEYIKALVSLLPKDVNLNVNKFEDMDDDQLLARIRQLDAAVIPALAAHGIAAGEGRADGRVGDETTH